MSRRTEMIGSNLQHELMQIIMRQLHDPRLDGILPGITRVKVSTDLATADVYITVMGTDARQKLVLDALKSSAGMMRERLRKTLPMRTIPTLRFHIDEALKKELTVLELIDKAVREENERNPAAAEPADESLTAAEAPTAESPNEEREQAHRESEEPAQEADQGRQA